MNKPISRIAIIFAIVKKDIQEYWRDKLWAMLTALGIVMFVILFHLMPDSVDETISLGIHQTGMDQLIEEFEKEQTEGLAIIEFNSTDELKAAVAGDLKLEQKVAVGIDFPEDFVKKLYTGEKTVVQVYVGAGVPKEISQAMSSLVREIGFTFTGYGLPVTEPDRETIVIGEDRVGNQIPLKDRMRPMLVFFLLITESFALASLISGEIQSRTVTALLITPARTSDILAAKAILGTLLAFVQALILLIALQALGQHTLLLLATLFLASIMVSGIGMITGSSGKDFMGTLLYGILFLIPLMIPAIASIFPGTASVYVKLLPTYGVVQGVVNITAYGEGWAGLAPDAALIIIWDIIILSAGWLILKRKVEML